MHLNRLNSNPDKKIPKQLESNLIAENYHLKGEIIKIRKSLKSYQQKLYQYFHKWSKELSLTHQNGFIFDTALEQLSFFETLIERAVDEKKKADKKILLLENQRKKTIEQYQEVTLKYNQLSKEIKKVIYENQRMAKATAQYKFKIQELQKANQNYDELLKQKISIEQAIKRVQNEYHIKMLEEKKLLQEKTNRDMASYRSQLDSEIYSKEKEMKIEIDDRDRKIKELVSKLNEILSGFPQNWQQSTNYANEANLFLRLSQVNKQNIELKKQYREITTKIEMYKLEMEQLKNQVILGDLKYKEALAQNQKLVLAIEKTRADSESLEHYYEQKWDSQFGRVKSNLLKQMKQRDEEISKKEAEVFRKIQQMNERQLWLNNKIKDEREKMDYELQKIVKKNEGLERDNKKFMSEVAMIRNEKNMIKNKMLENIKKWREIQLMSKQQIRSIKYEHADAINQIYKRLEIAQRERNQVQKQTYEQKKQFIKEIEVVKVRLEQQIKQKVKETEKANKEKLLQKQRVIEGLKKQIEQEREKLEEFKIKQQQKRAAFQEKIQKEREKLIKQLKNVYSQDINRLNKQLKRQEDRVSALRKEVGQKQLLLNKKGKEKQNIINELQINMDTLHLRLQESQKKNIKVQQFLQKKMQQSQRNKDTVCSLETEIKSLQLMLKDKKEQLDKSISEKQRWRKQISECRKQFQKGIKQIKKLHEQKVEGLRSRIWQLESINQRKGRSKKDYEKIKCLTQEKIKLQHDLVTKEAEKIVINQVKQYYEKRTKSLSSKLVIDYALKNEKQPLSAPRKRIETQQHRLDQKQISNEHNFEDHTSVIEINAKKSKVFHHSQFMGKLKNEQKTKRTVRGRSRTQTKFTPRINYTFI